MSPILAELFGTAILIVLGDGVVANVALQRTKGNNSGWIVITAGCALGVNIAVYAVNAISGGFALVLALLAVISPSNFVPGSDLAKGFGPVLVGVIVMAIGLSLGGPTGYAINPARDLGPRIAHAVLPIAGKGTSDWGYSWIPIAGPVIGGLIAAFLYKIAWSGT